MKRVLCTLLASVMLLSVLPTGIFGMTAVAQENDALSSVSSGTKSQPMNSMSELQYSDNTTIFRNVPVELKGTTVLFSDFGEMSDDEYSKIFTSFSFDTAIRVKTVQYLQSEYVSKVSQQVAAGKSPDVVVCSDTFPAALEITQPLPSCFDLNDGFWDKRVSEATKYNGQYYFVNSVRSPFTGGTVVYYNERLFELNGLKTPQEFYDEGQWTYENFAKLAKDISNAGYTGAMFDPLLIAQQAGSVLIDYDSATGMFRNVADDSAFVKAMQYYATGVENGIFVRGEGMRFVDGNIGMTILGTHGMKYNGYFAGMSPSWIGVVPLPDSIEGTKLDEMPLNYRGYGICKGAQNSDAAYYLLRYILDVDKYEPAGADIFADDALGTYFRTELLERFNNGRLSFSYHKGVLPLSGKGWDSYIWNGVKNASPDRVGAEFAKMEGALDAAVSVANYMYSNANGWIKEGTKWAYYRGGAKVRSEWMADSIGWCYLGADGYMLTNEWVRDSVGWCYVGADGYCVTNEWKRDSIGWCYLDANGRMATNQWIKDSVGWCYVGADGYCVASEWKRDSIGWCYLDANGRMATDQWVRDSVGWCYVGADGYCVTNTWKRDSIGWCYLDKDGRMVVSNWLQDGGKWYYFNVNGYMLANTSYVWGGKTYYFNASGVCTNP